MDNTTEHVVDISGKRTLDYVMECLSRFNRVSKGETITIRALGTNISNGVGVAQLLCKHFKFEIESSHIHLITVIGIESSCIEIKMRGPASAEDVAHYERIDEFTDFPVYHLLFGALLLEKGNIIVSKYEKTRLINVKKTAQTFECTPTAYRLEWSDLEGVMEAYYRSGLLLSPSWKLVGEKLSTFDDVIIGVDTNILLRAVISEQILSSIFIIDPREYVHTPNWVLIVIPSAVIHELEQGSNSRDKSGFLDRSGRLAFRALQEVLELNRSADIAGLSLTIVGEANPVLDTRVELRGLRDDFVVRGLSGSRSASGTAVIDEGSMLRRRSSGDMMIRAQFKQYLRNIDFHKGVFFLTADKSNAALARAESLHSIYFRTPLPDAAAKPLQAPTLTSSGLTTPLQLCVPIGRLIYEMAVQFGTILIDWDGGSVELQCDGKGDSLDRWLARQLRIRTDQLESLLEIYNSVGKVQLSHTCKVWSETHAVLLGSETI